MGWFADSENPVTPEGSETAELISEPPPDHLVPVEVVPNRVAIVTQTCDLSRSSDPTRGQPLVQVSPVVDLQGSDDLPNAQGGHSPHFAPLPALGPTMFADLRKCTTVEKSVLARVAATRSPGCSTDQDRAAFSRAVARQRGRFAFPDDFTRAFKPLQERLRRNRKKDNAEARRIDELLQIRAGCTNGEWFGSEVQVELVFLVNGLAPTDDDPDPLASATRELLDGTPTVAELAEHIEGGLAPNDLAATWNALVARWVAYCRPDGTVVEISARAESPDEYTIADAWRMPRLDLDHLSDDSSPS
jgi:hypothetical protein